MIGACNRAIVARVIINALVVSLHRLKSRLRKEKQLREKKERKQENETSRFLVVSDAATSNRYDLSSFENALAVEEAAFQDRKPICGFMIPFELYDDVT